MLQVLWRSPRGDAMAIIADQAEEQFQRYGLSNWERATALVARFLEAESWRFDWRLLVWWRSFASGASITNWRTRSAATWKWPNSMRSMAACIPASRVAGVNPMTVLREEG